MAAILGTSITSWWKCWLCLMPVKHLRPEKLWVSYPFYHIVVNVRKIESRFAYFCFYLSPTVICYTHTYVFTLLVNYIVVICNFTTNVYVVNLSFQVECNWDIRRVVHTLPKLSEISEKNWSTLSKSFLISHFWCKAMLKVWKKILGAIY